MDTEVFVKVKICFLNEAEKVPVTPNQTTVEDVILYLCKLFKIGPVTRHLFALKDLTNSNWMLLSRLIDTGKDVSFEFALRFIVPNVENLRSDESVYNFYYKQVRHEILRDLIPNLKSADIRSRIIGLCVLHMVVACIEDQISKDVIKDTYKKYVPPWARRKHGWFLKTPIMEKFNEIRSRTSDAHFIKSGYLEQFRSIVPHYLSEEYPCLLKSVNGDESDAVGIIIRVRPYDKEFPGISYKVESAEDVSILAYIGMPYGMPLVEEKLANINPYS